MRVNSPWTKLPAILSAAVLVLVLFPYSASAEDNSPLTEHWSFEAPTRHDCPPVKDRTWASNAVDSFILARIEEAGLTPNPQAAPHSLIRRLSFDLTGLPPSPAEVARFEKACGVDTFAATEESVDRMLGSPHFGERWAGLWLDVARYAEDQAHIVGKNSALFYPNAYRRWCWTPA